jgi:hypothetical protein
MAKPDIVIVDCHTFSRQRLCELRRRQLEARQVAQPRQLALFELKGDCRPAIERTAAGRDAEPSFFAAAPARRESVG